MAEKEMSFLDHLEELRWHLVRSFTAIFVVAIVIFANINFVFNEILLAHLKPDFATYKFFCKTFTAIGIDSSFCNISFNQTLQALNPTQQLMTGIWSSLILGFVVAFPYVLYQLWTFISPGMKTNERKNSRGFLLIASFLFFLGVLFGYYIVTPLSLNFLANYSVSAKISNEFDLSSVIAIVRSSALASGIVFELPIVIYFLTKVGIVTPKILRTYRKFALFIFLIFLLGCTTKHFKVRLQLPELNIENTANNPWIFASPPCAMSKGFVRQAKLEQLLALLTKYSNLTGVKQSVRYRKANSCYYQFYDVALFRELETVNSHIRYIAEYGMSSNDDVYVDQTEPGGHYWFFPYSNYESRYWNMVKVSINKKDDPVGSYVDVIWSWKDGLNDPLAIQAKKEVEEILLSK